MFSICVKVEEVRVWAFSFLILGGLAIVGGVLGSNFYAADVLSLAAYKQKSSRRSGQLVFIVVGLAFIALGIKFLVSGD
jgi:hypothetical protein